MFTFTICSLAGKVFGYLLLLSPATHIGNKFIDFQVWPHCSLTTQNLVHLADSVIFATAIPYNFFQKFIAIRNTRFLFIRKSLFWLSLNFLNFSRNWAWDFLKFFLTFTEINWLKWFTLSLILLYTWIWIPSLKFWMK